MLQITPGIIKQLRNNSSDSYSFNMSHPLPEVVVLLGGKDRLDRYVKENIKFLDVAAIRKVDLNGLQVLKQCRVSVRRHFCHPTSFHGRGCENGRSTEDPASES